jgi:hypothetical protein
MFINFPTTQNGWLAFELNVLRRLKFESVILPFADEPKLGAYLKRWNTQVWANDLLQSAWTKAVASIQNNGERLSDENINSILEDAYIPRFQLKNQALAVWFDEIDAWWFDNLRQNIEKLSSPVARAIALSVGMSVGDYVLSFDEETREFRQPLSIIFKRLANILPEPVDNGRNNTCYNRAANDFIAENYADLMFLRLPAARQLSYRNFLGASAWREEWLRGANDFWNDLETAQAGRLGARTETKNQYLRLLEETLRTASNIPAWAIAHAEDRFVSTVELVEVIGRFRRVDTVFAKDFSELSGRKAVVVTA